MSKFWRNLTIGIALLGVCPGVAVANPSGGSVQAGSAQIQGGAGTLNIYQSSDRAIINWQQFSIQNGELTQFFQPGSSSATLNRVLSGNPSEILGTLKANGQVYLINPNGILIGNGAKVQVGGFVGSTLDILDEDFMNGGSGVFSGNSAAGIVNMGTIEAGTGDVFLFARQVDNAGVISTPQGTVGMAAAQELLLTESGEQRIFVRAGTPEEVEGDGVRNTGLIQAARVELRAAAGNMYSLAVNNDGVVRATGTVERDGKVFLTGEGGVVRAGGEISARGAHGQGGVIELHAEDTSGAQSPSLGTVLVEGFVDASSDEDSGARGGVVVVSGDRVGMFDESMIDVSGDTGGGEVYFGGDYHGENPDYYNADANIVERGTTIKADARKSGDGGRVILWADDYTRFEGEISARGGEESGDGGFVEVSGKEVLSFDGDVDTLALAPSGSNGTLVLDPRQIYIVEELSGAGYDTDGDGVSPDTDTDSSYGYTNDGVWTYDENRIYGGGSQYSDHYITAGRINSLLHSGNVRLEAEDMYVNHTIEYTGGSNRTLTLFAYQNLEFATNTGIESTGSAQLSMDFIVDSNNNGGLFLMRAGSFLDTNDGSITISSGASNANVQINSLVRINQGTGSVSITSGTGGGSVTIGGSARIDGDGSVSITSSGNIDFSTNAYIKANQGSITLDAGNGSGRIYLQSGNQLRARTGITLQAGRGSGYVSMTSADIDVTNGFLTVKSGSADITASGGTVDVSGGLTTFQAQGGGSLSLSNLDFDTSGGVTLQAGTSGGDITFSSGTKIDESGSGSVNLNAGSGQGHIDLSGSSYIKSASGDVRLQGGNDSALIRMRSGSYIETTGGDIEIVSGSSGTGSVQLDGSNDLKSGGGDITLTAGTHDGKISIASGSELDSGNGDISMTAGSGFMSGNSSLGRGVTLNNVVVDAGSGSVSISGVAARGQANVRGVYLYGGTDILSTAGAINITGWGGYGSGIQTGVDIQGSGTTLQTGGGASITITGHGGATTTSESYGVYLYDRALVKHTGGGSINITGDSISAANDWSAGIFVGSSAELSTSGTITMHGTGGAGGNAALGITFKDGAKITGTPHLDLTGVANGSGIYNYGIEFNPVAATYKSVVFDGTGSGGQYGTGVAIHTGVFNAGTSDITITGTTTSAGTDSYGVFLNSGLQFTTSSGKVTITGSTSGSTSHGVLLSNDTVIQTGGGDIEITGTGGSGAASTGIYFGKNRIESTAGGSITLDGTSGSGGDSNYGIAASGLLELYSGSGDISLTGRGGAIGNMNVGLYFTSELQVDTGGSVTLVGVGGAGSNNNHGIWLTGADTLINSTGGNVSLTGTASGSGYTSVGIKLGDNVDIASTTGSLTLIGTGGAGSSSDGIVLENNNDITSTSGAIRLTGTGGDGGGYSRGLHFHGNDFAITSTSGTITLEGTGGDGDDYNEGIRILTGGAITTNNDISITGTGGNGTSYNAGIYFLSNTFNLDSGVGDLTLIGTGHGIYQNYGVYWSVAGGLSTTSGNLHVEGISNGTGNNNTGVLFANGNTLTTTTGNITLIGSSISTGTASNGVYMSANATIESGSGTISITGTSNNVSSRGLFLEQSLVRTDNDIQLSGQSAEGSEGIFLVDTTVTNAHMGGTHDMTITTNDLDFSGATITSKGILTLEPFRDDTSMYIGGTTGTANELDLAAVDFGAFTDGFTALQFGKATGTGSITINNVTFNDDVILRNGSGGSYNFLGFLNIGSNQLTFRNAGTALGVGLVTADTLVLEGAGDVGTSGQFLNTNVSIVDIQGSPSSKLFINNQGATQLAGSGGQQLSLNSGGNITQSGVLNLANIILNAGGYDVTLNHASNQFGDLTITADTVVIRESGSITQGAAWSTGVTSLTTSGDILLSSAGNVFGNLNLSGANVNVREADHITQGSAWNVGNVTLQADSHDIILSQAGNVLGGIAINSTSGDVTIVENDHITQSGAWNLSGQLALDAGAHDIVLTNAANSMGAIAISNVVNLSITDTGDITQNGAWTVGGTTTLSAGTQIVLNEATNDFTGLLTASAGSGSISMVGQSALLLGNIDAATTLSLQAGGTITQNGGSSVQSGAATFATSGNHLVLNQASNQMGDISITGSVANLTLSENDSITQSGSWTVTGATILNAGSNDIVLLDASNSFSGAIVANARNANLRTTGAMQMGASTLTGDLRLTSGGAITQSGVLDVADDLDLNSSGNSITLGNTSNQFGDVSIAGSISSLTLAENDAITQSGSWEVSGAVVLQSGASNDIVLSNSSNILGNITVSSARNVTLTEFDDITQGGAWSISGAILDAGTNDIVLTNASNDFSGEVSLLGANASLTDTNALTLGYSDLSGTLTIHTGLAISQTGALNTGGLTTLNSSGAAISLTNASNVLGAVALGGTPANFILYEDDAITQSGAWNVAGSMTLSAPGHDITLSEAGNTFGNVTLSGKNVQLTENDSITQSGAWSVTGTTALNAGGNDITLSHTGNEFTGAVSMTSNNATLHAGTGNDLTLGASTIGNDLDVSFGGHISQTGILDITGNSAFTASQAGASLALATHANIFGGDIGLNGTFDSVEIRNASISASTNFISGGGTSFSNLTLVFDTASISLGELTLSGDLHLETGGNISQTQDFDIGGATTLVASGSVDLSRGGNDFQGSVSATSGTSISLRDTNILTLHNIDAGTTLVVQTDDDLSQTAGGGIKTVGTASFDVNHKSLSLTGSGNQIGDIVLLDHVDDLTITEADAITQSGAWDVRGLTTLNSGANDITLTDAGNDFEDFAVVGARNVNLYDKDTLNLQGQGAGKITGNFTSESVGATLMESGVFGVVGDAAFTAGDFDITNSEVQVGGDLTLTMSGSNKTFDQSGTAALKVTGTSSFVIGDNTLVLDSSTNDFTGAVFITTAAGRDAFIRDANALVLGASSVGDDFGVTAGGAITQTGALTIGDELRITAANQNVSLTNAGNVMGNIFITGTVADLAITENGNITQGSAWNSSGVVALDSTGDIIVNNASNNFTGTVAAVSVGSTTIRDVNAMVMGNVDAGTTLSLQTAGNLTQATGTSVKSGGVASLNPGGQSVIFNNAGNQLGDIALAGTVSSAAINENDDITQSAAWVVVGATSLSSTGDIVVDNASNNFIGEVGATSTGSTAIRDANNLKLGNVDAGTTLLLQSGTDVTQATGTSVKSAGVVTFNTGTVNLANSGNQLGAVALATALTSLTLTEADDITQSGAWDVNGATSLNSGTADMILTDASNDFTGAVSLAGRNATLNAGVGSLTLGASDLSGTLSLSATSNIIQTGAVKVGGLTTIDASGQNITLTNAGNQFGDIALSASLASLSLTEDDDITQSGAWNTGVGSLILNAKGNDIILDEAANVFGGVTVTGDSNITLTENDAITQGAQAWDAGAATLNAGANDITLSHTGNDFSGAVAMTAANATVRDVNAIAVGPSTITTDLSVTGGTTISQTGALVVGNDATFTATLSNASLAMASFANDFGAAINFSGPFKNVHIRNANLNPSTGFLSSIGSGLGSVTVWFDHKDIELGAMSLSGDLYLRSGGSTGITQTDAFTVGGTTTLWAEAGDINLNNASNNFTGAVSLIADSTGAFASITDINALSIKDVDVDSSLTLSTSGAITQVAGAGIKTGGRLTLSTGGSSVDLSQSGNQIGDIRVNGTLTALAVTEEDAITQFNSWTVTGDTVLDAGANDITLDHASNQISNLSVAGASNVSVVNNAAITLKGQGDGKITGALDVDATGGNLTVDGELGVDGATTLTTSGDFIQTGGASLLANDDLSLTLSGIGQTTTQGGGSKVVVAGDTTIAAGDNTIVLNSSLNDFQGAVSTTNSNGRNVTLRDANTLTLGTSTFDGNLTATVGGDLTQTGGVTIAGDLSVTTTQAGAKLALADELYANTFGGNISLFGEFDTVEIRDVVTTAPLSFSTTDPYSSLTLIFDNIDNLSLGATTLAGDLKLVAKNISQTGAFVVGGSTELKALAGDIDMSHADNDFTGALSLTSTGGDISVTDKNALILKDVNAGNALNITVGDAITQESGGVITAVGTSTFDTNGKALSLTEAGNQLGDVAIVGTIENLTLVEDDAITQSGVWQVTGDVVLDAGANDITVTHASNDFGTFAASGGVIQVADLNALTLNDITASGALSVSTDGEISQGLATTISTGGTTTFSSNGNAIYLAETTNQLGDVAITGSISALTLSEDDGITQSGEWVVTGLTTLASSSGDIVLTHADNDFAILAATSVGGFSVVDTNSLTIGNVDAGTSLSIKVGDSLTQEVGASLKSGTTAQFELTGASSDLTLTNDGNQLGDIGITGTLSTLSLKEADAITQSSAWSVTGDVLLNAGANDVTLTQAGNTFGGVAITAGNVSLVENSSLTQSGVWSVASATINVGANNITLDNAANDFTGAVSLTANDAQIVDVNALELGASSLSGTLGLTAGGSITQSGTITAMTGLALSADGQSVTLTDAGNAFGNISMSGSLASLSLTESDDIIQSGSWSVVGHTALNSGGNDVILNNTSNELNSIGLVSVANVDIKDQSSLVLQGQGAGEVTGNLQVEAGGDMTQSGVLDVAGNVTLASGGDFTQLAGATINAGGDMDFTLSGTGGSATQEDSTAGIVVQGTTSIDGGQNDVVFDSSLNDFVGEVDIQNASGYKVTLRDSNQLDLATSSLDGSLDVGAALLTQTGALQVLQDFTLYADGQVVDLSNSGNIFGDIKLVGTATNLTLTENDAITQNGAWNVAGDVTLDSGANDISLSNADNSIGGAFSVSSAGNVSVHNKVDLNIADVDVSSDFNASSNASIIQATGSLLKAGGSITLDASASAMVLGDIEATGGLAVTAGGDVTQQSGTSLLTGGRVTLNAANHHVILSETGNVLGDIEVNGMLASLSLKENDDITQANAWEVAGDVVLDAGANDIVLDGFNNDFGDVTVLGNGNISLVEKYEVTQGAQAWVVNSASLQSGVRIVLDHSSNDFGTLSLSSAEESVVRDVNGLELDQVSVGTTLSVTTGGGLTQKIGGSIRVTGLTSINTNGNAISLAENTNKFAAIQIAGPVSALSLSEDDTITQSGAWNVTGNTVFNANGGAVNLTEAANSFGDLSIQGGSDLNLVEADDVTQGAMAWDAGNVSIHVGGYDVVLDVATNEFAGSVEVNANDVKLADANVLLIGASSATGNMELGASTRISQTGALSVDGGVTFKALTDGADLHMADYANLFKGGIAFDGVFDAVEVRNAALSASSDFLAPLGTEFSKLTLVFDHTGISLGSLKVSGDLSLTAGGDIVHKTGADYFDVGGTTLISTTGNVTLAHASNSLGTLRVVKAGNVNVRNGRDLQVTGQAGDSIYGDLTLNVAGNLNQSGTVSVGNALVIDATSASGRQLTQSAGASWDVAGKTTLAAGNNTVRLDSSSNDFKGGITVSNTGAYDVSLADRNDMTLERVSLKGNFSSSATGTLSQILAVEVDGNTSLSASQISLNRSDNDFKGAVSLSASSGAHLVDANSLTLGQVRVTDLTLASGGQIVQQAGGTIESTGIARLNSNGNAINFSNSGNKLGRLVVEAGSFKLVNAVDIEEGGSWNVSGLVDLNASGHNINMSNFAHHIQSVAIQNTSNASLQTSSSVTLTSVNVGSNLSITSGGNLDQSSSVYVGGALEMNVGGNVALSSASNRFGVVKIKNAASASLYEADEMVLGESNISGDLSLQSTSSIRNEGFVRANRLSVRGAQNVNLDNVNFKEISSVNRSGDFWLRDVGENLTISAGFNDSPGAITIETTGEMTIGSGARIVASGGADMLLRSGDNFVINSGALIGTVGPANLVIHTQEAFINNAGADAVQTLVNPFNQIAQGRLLLYSRSDYINQYGGIQANFQVSNTSFLELPPDMVRQFGVGFIFSSPETPSSANISSFTAPQLSFNAVFNQSTSEVEFSLDTKQMELNPNDPGQRPEDIRTSNYEVNEIEMEEEVLAQEDQEQNDEDDEERKRRLEKQAEEQLSKQQKGKEKPENAPKLAKR